MSESEHFTAVVIVGGGPTGLAAAITLRRVGIDVTVVDARIGDHPPESCGALTPRAVQELSTMVDIDTVPAHEVRGVRVLVHGRTVDLDWPEHPDYPLAGRVTARRDLDGALRDAARAAGAEVWTATTAIAPLVDDGILAGATVQRHGSRETDPETLDVRASYVLIADGALSHFGRALGTARNRSHPMGVVARTRLPSSSVNNDWIEAAIDLHDPIGAPIPGFGWVFPGNDGHVTAGVGLLTAFRETEGPPITDLLLSWLQRLPGHWGINEDMIGLDQLEIETGRLPMGGSVHPKSGPNWLVAGDAAGMASPINGAGLESALETGQIAASVLAQAITDGNGLVLRTFERYLAAERGRQLKVARLAARAVARPRVSRPLTNWASRSPAILGGGLRIVTGLLRTDQPGRAERTFERVAKIASIIPEKSS
jgi:geranylgeranyl reductase family protein